MRPEMEHHIRSRDAISTLTILVSHPANSKTPSLSLATKRKYLMASKVSEEEDVNLLLEECYLRDLLGWLHHTTTAHVIAAVGTFKTWQTVDPFDIPESVEESADDAVALLEQERKVRKLERNALLGTCYSTHSTSIQELAYHRHLQLKGMPDEWLAIKQKFSTNTLLHWIAALWKCEETVSAMNNTSTRILPGTSVREHFSDVSRPRKDDRVCVIILGDVPQEPGYEGDDGAWDMMVRPVHTQFYVDRDTAFTDFHNTIAELPIIRYHVTRQNLELANSLFVPDDEIHPPGLHASWDKKGNTMRPERFPKRADLVYENGPGRSYWSGIFNTSSQYDRTAFRSFD